jgi:hypothetical protein
MAKVFMVPALVTVQPQELLVPEGRYGKLCDEPGVLQAELEAACATRPRVHLVTHGEEGYALALALALALARGIAGRHHDMVRLNN